MPAVVFVIVPAFTTVPETVVTTDVPLVLYVRPLLMVSVPLISAAALAARVTFVFVPSVSAEPAGMTRSVPAPLPIFNVCALYDCKVILVLPDITNSPIVCVGTAVIVFVEPSLNCKMLFVAGVVRVGLQFVGVAQEPLSAPIHV